MSTLMAKMTREQEKLEKTRTTELDLAQQEHRLLRQQLTWYDAPPIPEKEEESLMKTWSPKREENEEESADGSGS